MRPERISGVDESLPDRHRFAHVRKRRLGIQTTSEGELPPHAEDDGDVHQSHDGRRAPRRGPGSRRGVPCRSRYPRCSRARSDSVGKSLIAGAEAVEAPGATQTPDVQRVPEDHGQDPETVHGGGQEARRRGIREIPGRHRDLGDPEAASRHDLRDDLLIEDEAVGVGAEVHRLQHLTAKRAVPRVVFGKFTARTPRSRAPVRKRFDTYFHQGMPCSRAEPDLSRDPSTTSAWPARIGAMIWGTRRGSYW